MTGLRFDTYDWAGGREAMLRFGPDTGPIVVAALPLFEEANRTRQVLATILRLLARHGIGGVLPDLPGTGDSLVATRDARLTDMRAAYESLARQFGNTYAIGLRSGALIDGSAPVRGRWHLTPQTGEELLRDLWRTRQATAERAGRFDLQAMIDGDGDYAGNALSRSMLDDLRGATVLTGATPSRIVRLETDTRPADLKLPGAPLWRRAEPGSDDALAQRLADDIAAWIATCEA